VASRADGAAPTVDAAVVLAADVSRSINDDEFVLERQGYAEAIQSSKLMDAISTGPNGAIALAFVEWPGESEQKVVVDWMVIRKPDDARAFAAALTGAPLVCRTNGDRLVNRPRLRPVCCDLDRDHRKVIDVSGDGTSNQGRPVTAARDAAVEAGAVINGLMIFNHRAAAMGGLSGPAYQPSRRPCALLPRERDRGGAGAFVVPIDDFGSFGDAMLRKLVSEIARK